VKLTQRRGTFEAPVLAQCGDRGRCRAVHQRFAEALAGRTSPPRSRLPAPGLVQDPGPSGPPTGSPWSATKQPTLSSSCPRRANDACALLGATYTWDGSATGRTTEMVMLSTMRSTTGSTHCLLRRRPTAFNTVTDQALAAGILWWRSRRAPATSGTTPCPTSARSLRAGAALAERMLLT